MTLIAFIIALVIIDSWLFVPDSKVLPEAREVRR